MQLDARAGCVCPAEGEVFIYDPRRLENLLHRRSMTALGDRVAGIHWQNAIRKKSGSASVSTSQSAPSSTTPAPADPANVVTATPSAVQAAPDAWPVVQVRLAFVGVLTAATREPCFAPFP